MEAQQPFEDRTSALLNPELQAGAELVQARFQEHEEAIEKLTKEKEEIWAELQKVRRG